MRPKVQIFASPISPPPATTVDERGHTFADRFLLSSSAMSTLPRSHSAPNVPQMLDPASGVSSISHTAQISALRLLNRQPQQPPPHVPRDTGTQFCISPLRTVSSDVPADYGRYGVLDEDDQQLHYPDYLDWDEEEDAHGSGDHSPLSYGSSPRLAENGVRRRDAFSPIYEDDDASPAMMDGTSRSYSSPADPQTPFGDYVDRAVLPSEGYERGIHYEQEHPLPDPRQQEVQVTPPAQPDPIVTPSAGPAYKRLAGAMSEWMASFIWRACTTGQCLSPEYLSETSGPLQCSAHPPQALTEGIYGILLSTLLQPSCIFLSLQFLASLPICFTAEPRRSLYPKEAKFRSALLLYDMYEEDLVSASFRLAVLGCMFANKWLDDHTFSNKTWSNISSIQLDELNYLESSALAIFDFDVTPVTSKWTEWLEYLSDYHQSLTHVAHRNTIARPSKDPHSLVKGALEEVLQASNVVCAQARPEPIFVELQQDGVMKSSPSPVSRQQFAMLNLDDDGPLRDEYVPKRTTGHIRQLSPGTLNADDVVRIAKRPRINYTQAIENILPSPAKWHPEADERFYSAHFGHGKSRSANLKQGWTANQSLDNNIKVVDVASSYSPMDEPHLAYSHTYPFDGLQDPSYDVLQRRRSAFAPLGGNSGYAGSRLSTLQGNAIRQSSCRFSNMRQGASDGSQDVVTALGRADIHGISGQWQNHGKFIAERSPMSLSYGDALHRHWTRV